MSWVTRAAVAALLVSGSTAATAGIAAQAQAQIRLAGSDRLRTWSTRPFRPGFSKILVTINGGHSLYEHPGGSLQCQLPEHLAPAADARLEDRPRRGRPVWRP